jgi:hypothetical protein
MSPNENDCISRSGTKDLRIQINSEASDFTILQTTAYRYVTMVINPDLEKLIFYKRIALKY